MTKSNTDEIDIEAYAEDIVNSWDQDTLFSFAVEQMIEILKATPGDQFLEEYEKFYEEQED